MKPLLTTLVAICAFTITCHAQWTTGGTNIYNSNTGNVGIGTTNPAGGKLVIDANTPAPAIALHINNSAGGAGNNGAITFGGSGTSAGAYGFIDYNPNSASGIRYSALGPLIFGSNTNAGYGSSAFTEIMRIAASGNVGINTASPASRFHLYENNAGNNASNGLTIEQAGTGNAMLQFLQTGVQRWTVGIDNANAQSFKISAGQGLGTADKLTILASGRTGIGTNAPGSLLEIYGASQLTPALTDAGTRAGNIAANTNFTSVGAGSAITFGNVQSNTAGSIGWAAIKAYLTNGAGNTIGDLTFSTRNAIADLALTERMRIAANGNVGIGTISPDQALTVNGQVHSTSVVVTSTVPADYVFNTDYYLRPLADVKAFVDKNHHLPEVPSAAEFEKDGQNLGEMNMTLLKKVEELTLYMLEKDKEIKILQSQNEKLKKQEDEINVLKTQVEQLIKSKK